MPKATKFGTFSGVYTPSVLTILGVIMYMRLGWVVGEAGLYAAIAIILVAHIISITTGLSISSIATDKKIKTGGIYYILSRSLGLPMGGSIGITLFVGTALSIALYIVGFSESFLGIQAISDFLGLQSDIDGIRIVGSIILLLLVVIAFISTSLAIKSQFIVLGAIGLSLIAIVGGFFFGDQTAIQTNFTGPAADHVSMITIFAIFFPAVTGFTAGVAMSGDLQDPKKSIPKGTLLSILTGLIVYLGLAFGFAYFVDRDLMINDTNFINRIAFWSWPVIAGIWGATLSSALGGILGAPRIMQAIAKDKIMPKIFGKGYGETNEPRNALIFTFILAELGVLMGELDAIAEVVSMFYIAAYGFINLAFALESWANTDFRPSFKISRWVGIFGFLASFGVMLQLNPGAMFAAFIIMWFIYFILKRRELKSDFGDVWSSVWSSIIRTSLNKLSEKQLTEQNWTPNILLFSGGSKNRPHLIEFGKQLVGKYGFLSNFDLVVKKEDEHFLFARHEQNIKDEDSSENQGFFTRRQSCTDIFSGIEQVASNYGFAGVEPNTVFMGWPRHTKEPNRFYHLLRNIQKLDLNIVMMDYDQERGFGNKKQIDVWWRGGGQNGNLSLQLVKFILQSDEWNHANTRLIIVNPVNEMHEQIYRKAEKILNNLRIDAEIKVINNQIDKRSFYDIVQIESVNSDLIFMGIEPVQEAEVEQFSARINALCHSIGTVILSRASTHFKELNIGLEELEEQNEALFEIDLQSHISEDKIEYPAFEAIQNINKLFYAELVQQNNLIKKDYIEALFLYENHLRNELQPIVENSIQAIKKALSYKRPELISKKINHIHSQFLLDSTNLINKFRELNLKKEEQLLKKLIENSSQLIKDLYKTLPKELVVNYNLNDMQAHKGDILDISLYKRWNRFLSRFGKKNFKYHLQYRDLLTQHAMKEQFNNFEHFLNELGTQSLQNLVDFAKCISNTDLVFQELSKQTNNDKPEVNIHLLEQFDKHFSSYTESIKNNEIELLKRLDQIVLQNINYLNKITSTIAANALIDEEYNYTKAFQNAGLNFKSIPEFRKRNQKLQLNNIELNLNILNFSSKLKLIAHEIEKRIEIEINDGLIANYNKYIDYLEAFHKKMKKGVQEDFSFDIEELNKGINQDYSERLINLSIRRLKTATNNFPETIELFTEESDNLLGTKQFTDLETMKISATSLLDYMIQNNFNGSIKAILDEIPSKSAEYENHLIDQYRLTSYSLSSGDFESIVSEDMELDSENLAMMIESQIKNLKNDRDEIIKLKETYFLRIEERLQDSLNSIAIYPFIQAAGNLKQYIKQQQNKESFSKIVAINNRLKIWIQEQFAQIWYRQSQGVILTQELLDSENSIQNNQALRALYRNLYSEQTVFEKLPFYYRQLFLRKHNFMREMWVGRKTEMQLAKQSLSDYSRGMNGGILVIGERYSGKSFFAQMLATEYAEQNQIVYITPPATGSTNPDVFTEQLKIALDIETSVERHLRQLKNKLVIIIDDLELWWEKQADGQKVISQIHELIRRYGNKVLFISTINTHSYKVINKAMDIEAAYINAVMMGAMDAKEINEMIMTRHNTSGLKFTLKKKSQEQLHTWDYAKLFNHYFNFSRGIPGIAIHSWVNNITEFDNNNLRIKYPIGHNTDAFDQFSTEQNWHLLLFVLHKNMSLEKFSRLTKLNKHESFLEIEKMMRKGLIYKTEENVFRINILMHHLIVQHLQNNRLL
jgi:amino acid transporter